jgi:hypothetical protein
MEVAFGHDFSGVRVHADDVAAASAAAVDAVAYTVGRHVAFARGAYAPGTPAGYRLLAHELAHVVQQTDARPSSVPAVPAATTDSADEREAVTAASALTAGAKPSLTARPLMIARQSASSPPGTGMAGQPPGLGPPAATHNEPAPVFQPSRNLEADFLRVLEEMAASRGVPQRVRLVLDVLDLPSEVLTLILHDKRITLAAGEGGEARAAFWAAMHKFVPQQVKAIEKELITGSAQGPAEWEVVLHDFERMPELLNQEPFAGMKDRVEDALLKASAARAEKTAGKPPAGHQPAVPTLLGALHQIEQQLINVYGEGTKEWKIPPEVSLDVLTDVGNAGAAASALGSILTALPGMELGGMTAAEGVGLAVGTLGVGLIAVGTITALVFLFEQHAAAKDAAEAKRRADLEQAIQTELMHGVYEIVQRYHQHEALIVSELVVAASREKLSLDSPIPVWEKFVWSHLMPGFPTDLVAGRDWVANKLRSEFHARVEKK